MARAFLAASSESLSNDTAVVTGEPFTMACWFFKTDTAQTCFMSIADKDEVNEQHRLIVRAAEKIEANTFDGGQSLASSTTTFTANTWEHACGVWAASDDRRAYLNGGSKGTNGDSRTVTGINAIEIGVTADSTPFAFMEGSLAECGVWNVALSDDDVAALGTAVSPLLVRRDALVFYAPLLRDADRDIVGGLSLTANGTPTIAVHPRMFYPVPMTPWFAPAPVVSSFIPYPNPRYSLSGGLQPAAGGLGC